MPYSTTTDVQARCPQFTISATSKPTTTDVSGYIDDVDAELDAIFENLGYVTPITGTKALKLVKVMSAIGALARTLQARASAVGGDAAVQSAERAQKEYDGKLKALADPRNPLELIDAGRTSAQIKKPSDVVLGLLTDEDGNDLEPRATMDQKL